MWDYQSLYSGVIPTEGFSPSGGTCFPADSQAYRRNNRSLDSASLRSG